jgi:hypothetical protein
VHLVASSQHRALDQAVDVRHGNNLMRGTVDHE